jgi:hypothetical protein
MNNEYFSAVEDDAGLYAVVRDKLTDLGRLSTTQIEKLVFYLKSLHSYYPKSENHVTFFSEFGTKLDKLRNTAEQVAMQRQAGSNLAMAIGCCTVAGLLLAGALLTAFGDQISVAIGLLVVSIALVLLADSRFLKKAILVSKEQERKYFLSSIRTARACNELDWAGLFTYNEVSKPGTQSDADLARTNAEVGRLTAQLRAALYNDEFFQYSPTELRVNDKSDA